VASSNGVLSGQLPSPAEPVRQANPSAPGAAPSGGRPRWALLAVVPAVLVVAVLLTGFAGVAPWSKAMPFGRSGSSSSSSDLSFGQARTAAAAAFGPSSGGPWNAVSAIGVAISTPASIPGPTGSANFSAPGFGCGWTPLGAVSLASLTIPATTGSLGVGLSAAWLFLFTNASGRATVVTVLNGQASLYASLTSGPCSTSTIPMNPIGSSVIDSTQAASIANSWGGNAFRANYSVAGAIYSISGSMSYPVYPPCGGPVNCTGISGYGNGSQEPPPGSGAPWYNITVPSVWSVMFVTCVMPVSVSACSGPLSMFSASLDPVNGTVHSVSATGAGSYGFGLPPPVPVGSPATRSYPP
jgi:hypothetical protein